jgi:hypothetical protein
MLDFVPKSFSSLLNNYSAGDPSASRFITWFKAIRKPLIYAGGAPS